MRWKPKVMKTMALGLVLTTFLAGCSSSTGSSSASKDGKTKDGKVELRMTWWGSQSRHDQTQEIIKKFEEENPDIKITSEFTGFDGYFEKMAAQAAGNNLPDIMQQNFGEYLNQYADKNLLADLSEYVEDGTINVDGVSDIIMDSGKQGDKILGIPTGTNALTAFYNVDMLKEVGVENLDGNWSWDEYVDIATKVHEKTGEFGTRLMEPKNLFEYYLREKGQKLFNEDGTALGYKDDKLLSDYFELNKKMVDAGVAPGYDTIQQIKGVEDELIVHGKAPFDFRWSNQATALDSASEQELAMTLLPGDNNREGMFLKPAMLWSVSENSKHKEEAARFIDFFTNNIEVYEIGGSDRGVPIKEEIRNEMASTLSDTDKKVFDYIEMVTDNSSPIDSNYPQQASEVLGALQEVDELVMYGQLSPKDGAKEFRKKAESILGR
ncbi:extracellular solute-binding protein [Rossellomorea marisflavi]|uniref:ABC transporter substrate-binding protein n=1 Tax=Rossellomorea marisflavi TaxID=189381 RepID=UPI00203ECFDD|nr:extracellular solute-binding protein [Rossellomorea marisflavi]MCM2604373.1 extracellular solute-binding protein [Rossellomorea marisflavi]USK91924.1 extracellular solute-binding protein [Rossellomorea marisflavi]